MKKMSIKGIAICTLCTISICGNIAFGQKNFEQKETIFMLENNISSLDEQLLLKREEAEEFRVAGEQLTEEVRQLENDLESARQRIYELRAEIDRIEESERAIAISRGQAKTVSFTSSSDITQIRINNGDVLELGLKGNLKGLGWAFVNAGIKHGIDPLFLAAISAQESGWGQVDHGNNNIFGISSGAKYFSSYEECIEYTANLLAKYYVGEGRTTPALIQPKYCPSPDDWHYKVAACANTILSGI